MAKTQDSSNVVIMFGDPFAESPTRLQERAQALVTKATGTSEAEEKRRRVERFKEDQEGPVSGYPTSAAEMQGALGLPDPDRKERVVALYFGKSVSAADLTTIPNMHIVMAGGHCGDVDCTKCDPMERMVDGLTVRECLEKYGNLQRCDMAVPSVQDALRRVNALTADQKDAARAAWSLEIKRKQQAAKASEPVLCVDDDRWEP